MYLTRIELDLAKRRTLQALSAPNIFHGCVESCFNHSGERKLWRIDKLNGKTYLLMVSPEKPELRLINEQLGVAWLDESKATKNYDPFLSSIQKGVTYRFRITANPTKSLLDQNDKAGSERGKVVANITDRYQKKWLCDRAEKHGFSIDEQKFEVVNERWFSFRKQKGGVRVTLLSVTFEGFLTVNDPEKFRDLLCNGLGREKAFGMGMMTVIPIR